MPQNSKIPIWIYTLGRVLIFCICCAIVLAVSSRIVQELPKSWSQILLAIISCAGALMLTLLFVRWEGLHLSDVGVAMKRHSILRVFIGFILGFLLAVLQPALVLMTGHIKLVGSSVAKPGVVLTMLVLYFFAAGREEIAFHGYPLRSLNYILGPWWAQCIVALIFALEHVAGGMTWRLALAGSGVGSLLFGIASLKTKGLAMPIGIHAAWNFGQWSLGFKKDSGIWQATIEKGYETRIENIGLISYLFVFGLAILAFYYYGNKLVKRI